MSACCTAPFPYFLRLCSDPTKCVKLVVTLPDLGALSKRLLYSPDAQFLMTSTITGRIRLWNANTDLYKSSADLRGHTTSIKDAAFSPDSRFLATSAVEMAVHVWDVAAGGRIHAAWYGPINCLDFISNDLLVVGEATGNRRYLRISQ